jgi:hypothetical protein
VPFSKFDPHRELGKEPEGTTPAATRRAMVLRWGTWITWAMTLLGFLLMAYWLMEGDG